MKHYSPTGKRNHGRPLERLLHTWDWNGSTSGPSPWQIWWWWWWWWWYVASHPNKHLPVHSLLKLNFIISGTPTYFKISFQKILTYFNNSSLMRTHHRSLNLYTGHGDCFLT
jgi:hypothetical protein